MADKTRTQFLYPPNFTGSYDNGEFHYNGCRRYVVKCTNISDGTGEDDAIKVHRTSLHKIDGQIPDNLVIEKIDYSISGMRVEITYNNDNDERVAVLQEGQDCIDFRPTGGFCPESDGGTGGGDIVFTTGNETSGDSYDITLTVRPK
jgi:hypothetical protein